MGFRPPGSPPPGAPPGPPGGPPPPGAPPPPPPQAPPAPPPVAPPIGASPAPSVYADLSVTMPPHWQLIDVASRNILSGLQTGGFYDDPPVYAALKSLYDDLVKLISAYSSTKKPTTTETVGNSESMDAGEGDYASSDNEPSPVDSSPEG